VILGDILPGAHEGGDVGRLWLRSSFGAPPEPEELL